MTNKRQTLVIVMVFLAACASGNDAARSSDSDATDSLPPVPVFDSAYADATAVAANGTAQAAYAESIRAREMARGVAAKSTAGA